MTTVSYLITAAEGENLQPYLSLIVENQEAIAADTDKAFLGIMCRNTTLASAIRQLMDFTSDGVSVFVPHIRNVDADYIIECALVGEAAIGCLPSAEDRLFTAHLGETSADIGNGVSAVAEGVDRESIQKTLAYLQYCNAERNERRLSP